jgi:hypothetical protein
MNISRKKEMQPWPPPPEAMRSVQASTKGWEE